MISSRRAFNKYTTAVHEIELYIEGYYDEKNNWIPGGLKPAFKFRCTPIAYGDRDSGTNGQQLKATEVGERQPAFMQVHSLTEMPMKSVLTIYGIKYKVVSVSDYADTGYYRVVAAKVLET